MARRTQIVRLSSKGQIIIPAGLRRELRLKTGQHLAVRSQEGRSVVFTPLEKDSLDLKSMLEQARSWVEGEGRDLVEELHERRRKERLEEAARFGRRRP